MIFMGLVSVVFMIAPAFFMKIFIQEPEIVEMGAVCLRIIAYGFVFYGLGMVMIQALNGAGDTATPTLINLVCFWLTEIPLAYLLALKLGVGENAVYFSIIIAETLMTLIAVYFFRRGKWKLREV
jgi:Na+-driven multidrug efflux pump